MTIQRQTASRSNSALQATPKYQRNVHKPHIVLVIPRGEVVRNFLYSDTLRLLSENARITLLSVIHDDSFCSRFGPLVDDIIPLSHQIDHTAVRYMRGWIQEAHFRWLWSKVAQNHWEQRTYRAKTPSDCAKWTLLKSAASAVAYRPMLEHLTSLENKLSWRLRPNDEFVDLFTRLKPDLVFNGSHIHGASAELPVKIAHRMGITTAGFIFSWDNLTSRSRIFVPYDHYFVWHEGMKDQLLTLYPRIRPERVHVTGTPQFDFHFKSEFHLPREELAKRIGTDPNRPFIFYTAGIDHHFPEEHRHVEAIAQQLQKLNLDPSPQLVVRTYIKGTSPEMRDLADRNLPDVVFPKVAWDHRWYMPLHEDLATYTSCLRHSEMGINAASTVSLELLMFDKPVMNLGFDPPGSRISYPFRWKRHIEFDHFQAVAESGATLVAQSSADVLPMLKRALRDHHPDPQRRRFIHNMFGETLDGNAGARIAEKLLTLASNP